MKIDTYSNGLFQIIKLEDELSIISDLSELKFLIDGYITQGKKNIAVEFKDTTYIYSGAIAVLVQCYKALSFENKKGNLCIIERNKNIRSIFSTLELDRVFKIYCSEDELPSVLPE